jgi:polyferredoxin
MMGCARAAEVQELMRLGHWPQAAGMELREHVCGCRRCGEMVLLTEAFGAVKASSMNEARVDPPALVWWRAQLRRRHEVMQRVERPMRAQMLVVLAVVCVGLGLAFRLSGGAAVWRSWLTAGAEAVVRSSVGSFGVGLVIASAVALAMMAGLAVYMTVERK